MEIITNYSNDTRNMISGSSYSLDSIDLSDDKYKVKLSVFSAAGFSDSYILTRNEEYYVKNGNLFLRPNELLDREHYVEGNYTLRFDFLERYLEQLLYVSEISSTRKEIRLKKYPPAPGLPAGDGDISEDIRNFLNESTDPLTEYTFNSFLELDQSTLIPINSYVFDNITGNAKTLILKLNTPLPSRISELSRNFYISTKWLGSQEEDIFFVDREKLVISGRGLEIDTGYLQEAEEVTDDYKNYNELSSSVGLSVIKDFQRTKKDRNLNIDYSSFSNHTFFGSAEQKLKNFKDKAVKLEGLFTQLSASLSFSSSKQINERRRDLFEKIDNVKDEFTAYEYFLYNDNQNYSTASAPGLGSNLAGVDFSNKATDNYFTKINGSEGFDVLYHKSSSASTYLHLFTDIYNVEQPPFYNTNKDVYLSFIAKGFTGSAASSNNNINLHISGGDANISFQNSDLPFSYKNYDYGRNRLIPYEAYSSASSLDFSQISNPISTGSHYKRYIFKGKQEHWRPSNSSAIDGDIFNISPFDWSSWSGSAKYEILSGSENVLSASISGSTGDGFAYGIKDSSGKYTPYLFPNYLDKDNLGQTFTSNTASVMPTGDLFPVVVGQQKASNVFFTDIHVSYNNPTDVHPFSLIYRPPSGSYAGSTKWNTWYDGLIISASNYDNDNIHSFVNNLPFFLRTDADHEVLRKFVNMLGEQFDLLRNYIDNYHNFYKLGYKNPSSMPDNLLPILGDSLGWKMLSPYSGSSLNDYISSNLGGGAGIQSAINATWKKILNNLVYVYKTKGTTQAISSLLNLYGFDANSFRMREYGGSTEEHNPSIITNDSANFLEGMKNIKGNVSYVKEISPFLLTNFNGSSSMAIDWWTNDANPNGIEFLFNTNKSTNNQTLLRSSGSNDYWDLRVIPSGSSNTKGKIEFRLNYKKNVSSAIGTNHISMSTAYIDNIMGGNIFNIMVQRHVVTASNALGDCDFSQSYHMFVARKDDDKIKDVNFISMSSHDSTTGKLNSTGSFSNQNFITSSAMTSKNLFVGETLTGSIAEVRAWSNYVSMSKFKQHVINYQSIVGNKISSSVAELIYRYKLGEGIANWNTTSNSASLKIYDANSNKIKDYSFNISSQSISNNFNPKSVLTEQTFYKLAIKGTDSLPNDNQINLAPVMTSVGQLDPDVDIVSDPKDSTGEVQRIYSNKFGREISYVNVIDSLIMNMLPDFRIDDFIGDPDENLTETYQDLLKLRKSIIEDSNVSINVVENQRAVENILNNAVMENLEVLTPAKTKFEFSYNVKNDALFRSKMKQAKLQTQLNPNYATATVDVSNWDEPNITSFANQNYKTATVDASDWEEPTVSSTANENFKSSIPITLDNRVTPSGLYQNIRGGTAISMVDTSNSARQPVYSVTPKVGGGNDMTCVFLGWKNEIAKNYGTASNNRFFKSKNQGIYGDYNTYKYETRYTFKTIGDTEVFRGSASIHDNFKLFENRYFVDQNDGFSYKSYFGVGAGTTGNAPKDGRMVGRTRFFSSSNGEIFYPSNHYIYARTSKDVLNKLIYKGTQHNGSPPTKDPLGLDTQPTSSAYTINVGGSDTLKKLKVIR